VLSFAKEKRAYPERPGPQAAALKVLTVDIGGSHVKLLVSGKT
jgi:hypothetical protein